jgi:CIC family chloride channel protein
MTALLLVFEMTRNYEITIAAMIAVVFANLIASIWYGRSLYDQQLSGRGIDLSLGRERAYLMHHKVGERLSDCLPVVLQQTCIDEAGAQITARQTATAVVVDDEHHYLGILSQQQLIGLDANNSVASIEFQPQPRFNENTSIWDAMQIMRSYMGEAIAVVDSSNGRYLGAIAEAAVISAYLDATEELRREEHEI